MKLKKVLLILITSIISVIFVKKFDVSTFKYKTSIDFSQILELDYISLIGKNLLIYAGIIAGIALIYYLASLIIKKEVESWMKKTNLWLAGVRG